MGTASTADGIEVTNNAGFLCHIRLQSKLDISPQAAFDIVTDPDNARFFRNVSECTHRKILHDDHHGRQRVEVDHKSDWKFLWHHGSFTTSLLVEQDDKARVMAFKLRQPGFMKSFEGFWRMEEAPGDEKATQAVLHQNVLPCVTAPGLNWLVTRICRAQIEGMLHDLKQEIGRLDRGDPVPAEQQEKMKGKRSWAQPDTKSHQLDFSSDEDDSPRAPAAAESDPAPDAPLGQSRSEAPSQQNDWTLLKAAESNMITPPPAKENAGGGEPPAVAIT